MNRYIRFNTIVKRFDLINAVKIEKSIIFITKPIPSITLPTYFSLIYNRLSKSLFTQIVFDLSATGILINSTNGCCVVAHAKAVFEGNIVLLHDMFHFLF